MELVAEPRPETGITHDELQDWERLHSISNFLEVSGKTLQSFGVFIALTIFARDYSAPPLSDLMSFLSLAIAGVLFLELRNSFPPRLKLFGPSLHWASRAKFMLQFPTNRLAYFSILLDLTFVCLVIYDLSTFWAIWVYIGLLMCAFIMVAVVHSVRRKLGLPFLTEKLVNRLDFRRNALWFFNGFWAVFSMGLLAAIWMAKRIPAIDHHLHLISVPQVIVIVFASSITATWSVFLRVSKGFNRSAWAGNAIDDIRSDLLLSRKDIEINENN